MDTNSGVLCIPLFSLLVHNCLLYTSGIESPNISLPTRLFYFQVILLYKYMIVEEVSREAKSIGTGSQQKEKE